MTEPTKFGKYSKTIRELTDGLAYLGEMLVKATETERERCAKIAEKVGVLEAPPADEFERGLHEGALRIAAEIRSNQ